MGETVGSNFACGYDDGRRMDPVVGAATVLSAGSGVLAQPSTPLLPVLR